jgi:hypothetical protein
LLKEKLRKAGLAKATEKRETQLVNWVFLKFPT